MNGVPRERRRLPRYVLPGGVRPDEDSLAPPIEILDIGAGGIRFETDRRLPPGHRIRFWFDYYVMVFRVQCEVTWARLNLEGAWEHGARFVDLSRSETVVVERYVQELHQALKEQGHPVPENFLDRSGDPD
jgi:hypothetical protein